MPQQKVDAGRRMVLNRQTGRMEPPQRTQNPPTKTVASKRKQKPSARSPEVAVKKIWWFSEASKKGVVPPALPATKVQNRHEGELVFVLASGPSLRLAEKYRFALRKYTTIGVNLSYLFMECDYLVGLDKILWKYNADELLTLESTVFYPVYRVGSPNRLQFFTKFTGRRRHPASKDKLSGDFGKGLYIRGASIAAVNLAYVMGAKQIALAGVDLNGRDHFFTGSEKLYNNRQINEYLPKWLKMFKGGKNQYPLSAKRLRDWKLIAGQAKRLGLKIWNCSPKSAVDCFEKIELGKLIEANKPNKKVYPGWNRKLKAWVNRARKLHRKKEPRKAVVRSTSTKLFGASQIHNRHRGELVFIWGNGPSMRLAEKYKETLREFTCIGVNLSYLMLPAQYLVFSDHFMWKYLKYELLRLQSHIFCQKMSAIPYFNQWKKYIPSQKRIAKSETLSPSWNHGLFKSISSAIAAVNLAYLFGASQIALLGIDLDSPKHFYTGDSRFSKNALIRHKHLWWGKYLTGKTYPYSEKRTVYWDRVAACLEKHGVKLWNCSPNSMLECADKIPLEKLLKNHVKLAPKALPKPISHTIIDAGIASVRRKPWDREQRG